MMSEWLKRRPGPETIAAAMRPKVEAHLPNVYFVVSGVKVDLSEDVIIYDMHITFPLPLTCDDVQTVGKAMETFCTMEEDNELSIPGVGPFPSYKFVLGDGDDTGACTMIGGVVRVWMRAWQHTEGGF